jgi:hypothetical protein
VHEGNDDIGMTNAIIVVGDDSMTVHTNTFIPFSLHRDGGR